MCCIYLSYSLTLALFSLLCCNFSCWCCCRLWSARHLEPPNGDFGVCFLSFCDLVLVTGLLEDDPDILGLFLILLFILTDLLEALLLLLLLLLAWVDLVLLWPLWLTFLPLPSCVLITPKRANSSSTTSLTSSCSSSIVSAAYNTQDNGKG